jgi:hypothetical protein
LPYFELTDLILEFHKKNQKIWKEIQYTEREYLAFVAKKELDNGRRERNI